MPRILMNIAYDGTHYGGFQIQKNAETIEGRLREALRLLLGGDTAIIGGSRTDAGVHAQQNVAVFDTDSRIPPEKFCLAINGYLPPDIRVTSSYEVPADFHPRKRDTLKTYKYRIYNGKVCPPTLRNYYYHVHCPLDRDAMRIASSYFVGTHDFTSFSNIHTPIQDKVRTLSLARIEEEAEGSDKLSIIVAGNGFLYNMVRIMAGTFIAVGKGDIPAERMKEILRGRNRELAGPTAPPHGLILWEYSFY